MTFSAQDLFYASCVLGCLGFIIDTSEYLVKDHQLFKKVAIVNALVWAAQYFCIASYTAGATLVFAAFRTYLSEKFNANQQQKNGLFVFSIVGFIFFGYLSWINIFSIFPVIALIITTHAMIYKTNLEMRKEMMWALLFWTINDFYWAAYFALASNLLASVFNWMSIRKLQKNEEPINEVGLKMTCENA